MLQRKFIAIKKISENADKAVAKALESRATSKQTVRGKYNSYTPEQRAEIGKYAVENGATNAAKRYTTTCSLA